MMKNTLKTKFILILLLGWLIGPHQMTYSQSYRCVYDVLEEQLILKDGEFTFTLKDPLDENRVVTGTYVMEGDTLIFNKGVQQNTYKILNCSNDFEVKEDGNYLKIIDEQASDKLYFTAKVGEHYLRTTQNELISLPNDFPTQIEISMISDRRWVNPYEYNYLPLSLACAQKGKNLMMIQLDLSEDFKIPFEYETKLLKKGDQLHYINSYGVLDLHFWLDTAKAEVDEKQNELLTPMNVFKGRTIYDFRPYFNPSLIDSFLTAYIRQDYAWLYERASDNFKQAQTKEALEDNFRLINQYYGDVKDYQESSSTLRTIPNTSETSIKRIAKRTYEITLTECKGELIFEFEITNKDTIKLWRINFVPEIYSNLTTIEPIAAPTLKAIQAKDKQALYALTSKRFKQYTSISDFEIFTEKVFLINVEQPTLYQTALGINSGNEMVMMIYELEGEENMLQLSYIKFDGQFQLEHIKLLLAKYLKGP